MIQTSLTTESNVPMDKYHYMMGYCETLTRLDINFYWNPHDELSCLRLELNINLYQDHIVNSYYNANTLQ